MASLGELRQHIRSKMLQRKKGHPYVIQTVGISKSGKSSLLKTLYIALTEKEASFSPVAISHNHLHGTLKMGPFRLLPDIDGCMILDTEGIVPLSTQETNFERNWYNKSAAKNVLNWSENPAKFCRDQEWDQYKPEDVHPQLVLIVVDCDIFDSYHKIDLTKSMEDIRLDIIRLKNTQELMKCWMRDLKSKNIPFRIALTKADLIRKCACSSIEQIVKNAKDIIGADSLHAITNYSDAPVQTDEETEKAALKLLGDCFDQIDIQQPQGLSFNIIHADFCKKNDRNYRTDVTQKLKQAIGLAHRFHIDPRGYVSLFGDPYPSFWGTEKVLEVRYSFRGRVTTVTVEESQALNIPL